MDNQKNGAERRNVKSREKGTTNDHERAKDFWAIWRSNNFWMPRKTRYPKRNYLLLLMMYRHGLRVTEAISLKRSDVNIKESRIWVNRLKNGLSVEHPISGDELRAVKGISPPARTVSPGCSSTNGGFPWPGKRWTILSRPRRGGQNLRMSTPIPFATHAGSIWPTKGTTCVWSRTIWGTAIPNIPHITQGWSARGSRNSGARIGFTLFFEKFYGLDVKPEYSFRK